MFKASLNYKYDKIDTAKDQAYRITRGDILHLSIFSNGGYQLLDVLTSGSNLGAIPINYLVKDNGYVKLPMIDSVSVQGKTIDEAEKMLQTLYSYYFVKPFVQLLVTNKRVIVFSGPSHGEIVLLDNNSSTLAEILARAGGLESNSKAYDIKIIRPGEDGKLKVEKVDLSKLDNVQQSQMRIFPNDVIYVTPGAQLNTSLEQLSPIIGFIVSALTLIAILNNGKL